MLRLSRIYILYGFILLLFVIFVGKLFLTQIVHGAEYNERADKQYFVPVENAFNRGSIYFEKRDGTEIAAATLQSGYTVAIDPEVLGSNPQTIFAKLKDILPDLDEDFFLEEAAKTSDPYEVIATHVDPDAGRAIMDLGITGVGVYDDQWRFYPGGSLASQVLGFVGYNDAGNALEGRYGLELSYDDVLSRAQTDLYVNFFAEVFADLQTSVSADNTRPGDIVLTIEPEVQQFLERELADVREKYQAEYAGGIVMDPKTGAIYAMANDPGFDPNNFQKVPDQGVFINKNVQNVFEMGSIMKALTMAAGLDSGAVTPQTTYDDTGCISVDRSTICNYDLRGRGVIPMQEVLNQSLNVGASFVATQMGSSTMRDYFLNRYQLGSTTGIDLPGEVHGLVGNLQSPRHVEYDTASFGQGIAVTPVEMIRALATLGNGGHLVTPHVVDRIQYSLGPDKVFSYPPGPQAIATSTSDTITRMLVTVVDKALANGTVALPTHSIAAKTGTAQVNDPSTGTYYPDIYFHSFFGYFPAYDPRFIVLLYVMHPQGVPFASETLTTPFMDIAKFLINYYEIPPDRTALSTAPVKP